MKKRLLSMLLVVCMVVSMLPMQVLAAEEDGWYWSDSTLYIKDGNAIDLYAALTDDEGINLEPLSYNGTIIKYSAEIKYASTVPVYWGTATTAATSEIAEGTYVTGYTNGARTNKWSTGASFTVKHYYDVAISFDGEVAPEGAGVNSTTTQKVCKGDNASLTITPVSGYYVKVTDSANNVDELTEADDYNYSYTPTVSTTLTVEYVKEDEPTYAVSSSVASGAGTVKLSVDGEQIAGTKVTITATPTNATGYVESVTVGGVEYVTADAVKKGSFADRVYTGEFTVGTEDVEVVVTFAERTITAKSAEVKVTGWKGEYNVDNSAVKAGYQSALVPSAFLESCSGAGDQNFVLEMQYTVIQGLGTASEWDSIETIVGSAYANTAFDAPPTTKPVRIVWNGDNRYPTVTSNAVTATIVESREEPVITLPTTSFTKDTADAFKAAVKDAIVVKNDKGTDISDSVTLDVSYSPDTATYPGTYTVSVKVTEAGESWLASSEAAVFENITATVNQYTVQFVNADGTVLQTGKVAYGETPAYTGETPTKTADAQYTYTFAGWTPAIDIVKGEATYTATYSSTVNEYTVTWVDEDGAELDKQTLKYGSEPEFSKALPSKDSDVQYTYTFDKWVADKNVAADGTITGDVTYTATYSSTVNEYTVTFKNGDDVLQSGTVAYGETPAYTGKTPTKAADAQYTYTFAGWSPAIDTVTGEATYTATFTPVLRSYAVKFVNEDGTELQSGKVAYGETPAYNGNTPTKAADAQYTYTFKGWDKEIVAVTGDVTYTATYSSTVNEYTVTFKNGDDVLQSGKVAYGETPAYTGETPVKAADEQYTYSFAGWTPAIVPVTGEAVYTATFAQGDVVKYTVTFYDEDGETVLQREDVAYGSNPTPPATPTKAADTKYTYTFAGWTPAIDIVKGEATYTATFTSVLRSYAVKFVNEDGTELQNSAWEYGTEPAYTGETPAKAADAQYTYTFAGWDKEIVAVNGEATYTATYTSTVNQYTITFMNGNDVLQSGKVAYGETPAYTGTTPTKAGGAQYSYTFTGWNPEITSVTGSTIYTAQFTQSVNEYTIGWDLDGDGTADETTSVAYGSVPTRADPTQEYYTFKGWTPTVVAVTGATQYTAIWEATNDTNENAVPDELEIAYVQVNVTGNGTVALSGVEGTVITHLGDGKYSVFYDTTNEAARTLTVTATPNDTTATDGGVDYVISAPASVVVAPKGTSTVTAEFGRVEMPQADPVGDIWLNGYLFDAEKITDLKAKVIEAAIGADANPDAYTVEMSVRGYYVDVANGWNALTIAGALDIGQSESFRITLNGTDPVPSVSKTISIAVKDSRQTLAITTEDVTISAKEEPSDVLAQIKAAIQITATDPQTGAETVLNVSDSYLSFEPAYAWPADGQTGTFEVTVRVNALANETYSNAPSATLTLTLKDTTVFYTVTYKDGYSAEGEDVLQQTSVAEFTATPVYNGVPTRENYSFAGWDIDGNGEVDEVPATVEGNITCTAVWTLDTVYTVRFLVDGEPYNVQTINLTKNPGTVVAKPADPDKDCAVFGGWTNAEVIGKQPTANTTLEAIWLPDENNNNVHDADETVTIRIVGNGSVTVNGKSAAASYPYDSTKGEELAIVAIPETTLSGLSVVSKSYAASITVDGVEQTVAYDSGFKGSCTVTVTEGSPVITVTFADAGFTFNEERLFNYYDGMAGVKNEDIYNAIVAAPVYSAEDAVDDAFTVTYKARDKMSHSISVDSLGLGNILSGLLKLIAGGENLVFDMPELWLDVNVEDEALREKIANSVSLEQAVTKYLTTEKIEGLLGVYEQSGLDGVKAELTAIYEAVYGAAMYYEAHPFGYNDTDAETVTEAIKVTYACEAYAIEDQSDITLKDLRAVSQVKGSNVSVMYKDYTDEELAALIGAYVTDAAGNKVAGAVVTSAAISGDYTFEGKGVSDTAYELTFKFAGDETYRPSQAAFTVTVTKAGAEMDLPNVIATYGEEYSVAPTLTLSNKYGEDKDIVDSLITFYIGLNIAEVDLNQDGVTGLNGEVKLMLPADLQEKLDALLELAGMDPIDGVDMTLSELQEYLSYLDDGSLSILSQALETIAGITEKGDISITLGGSMPKDIGAYLYGGVSTNGNYDTVYDVGYIVIKPDAQRVYLDWNYTDENGVFTWELLKNIDFGATAFDDEAFTTENAEATERIHELFFGVDDEGNFVAELDAITNADQLGNGAFVELAFIAEFGNEFYYAVPIIRPIVIIPNVVDVVFEDQNANDRFFFEFDNQAHGVTASVVGPDGSDITANGELTVTYTGIQTNTESWNSTDAPIHAGAYLVTATYTEKNETGEVTALGVNTAILVIGPTESDITVNDVAVPFTGEQMNLAEMLDIQATSTVEGHTPDTTVITASVAATDDVSENGWAGVTGVVNVDFPAWVDAILLEHAPSIYDGMTPAEFNAKVTAKIPSIVERVESILADKGTETDLTALESQLLAALAEIQTLVDQLPETVTLRFDETGDISVNAPGAYVVVGVVTDSDHYPSVDAGALLIVPTVKNADLKWNVEDANGIITLPAITGGTYDLGATAYVDGAKHDAATQQIVTLYLGLTDQGELVFADEITNNGAYTQIALIKTGLAAEMVIAAPILRSFVVVPEAVNVTIVDDGQNPNYNRVFVYDGTGHAVQAVVEGGSDKGTLTITYTGSNAAAGFYNSTEPPVNSGIYTAVATYVEYNEDGSIAKAGMDVGLVAILPAEAQVTVDNKLHVYDGTGVTVNDLVAADPADAKTTIITTGIDVNGDFSENGFEVIDGIVNVELPDRVEQVLNTLLPDVLADGISVEGFLTQIQSVSDALAQFGVDMTQLNTFLASLPQNNVELRFRDHYAPSKIGTYLVTAVVTDPDYVTDLDAGLLVISADVNVVDLEWNYQDLNGIITRPALDKVDLGASAFNLDGTGNAAATDRIETLFVGLNKQGEISVTTDANADFYNGAFTQLAYIREEISASMTLSAPILRSFVIVPQTALVHFEDANENDVRVFAYDGTAKAMIPVVTDLDGNPIDTSKGTLTITYVGADTTNDGYLRHEAPVNAGAYTVTATYAEKDETGSYQYVGIGVGTLIIRKADWTFDLLNTTVTYDGTGKFVDVTNSENADFLYVLVDKQANLANLVLEDDLNALVALLAENGVQVNTAYTLDELLTKIHGALDKAENAIASAAVEKVLAKLESVIPKSGTVILNGAAPVDAGTYQVYAAAYSANYSTEVSEGTLVIEPAKVTVTVADQAKAYGEADPELTYTVTGLVGEDELSVSVTRAEGENAGTYAITAACEANANYEVTVEEGTLTIAPVEVTVTVNNLSKFYGEADPELTYTVSGLVGEDELSVELSRAEGEDIGTYAITATYEDNANYIVTVVPGTLTIKDKAGLVLDGAVENGVLSVHAENLSVYDTVASFLVATYTDGKLVEVHMEALIPVDGLDTWSELTVELDGTITEVKFFALDSAHCPVAELWSWTKAE